MKSTWSILEVLGLDEVEAPLTNVIRLPSIAMWALFLLDLEKTRGHDVRGATFKFVECGMEALKKSLYLKFWVNFKGIIMHIVNKMYTRTWKHINWR